MPRLQASIAGKGFREWAEAALSVSCRLGFERAPLATVAATAAVLTQTIAWAHLQRPSGPGLEAFPEQTMEDATVDLIVSGLLQHPAPLP